MFAAASTFPSECTAEASYLRIPGTVLRDSCADPGYFCQFRHPDRLCAVSGDIIFACADIAGDSGNLTGV